MAMDAKDLRIESALGAHGDDGNTKYAQSGTAFQSNGNKPYDIESNSLAKADVPAARPCAIIGPDRVVPPQSTNDAYVKKVPVEPWPCTDSIYQHPPEYPHKPTEFQLSRNISPRQTFQENMQRIMVPPSYTSVKNSEDHCLKNPKLMPLESKFCDVPYTINPLNNEQNIFKSSEGLVLNNNCNQPVIPHGWASNGVNVRPLRPYGAPDFYQYSEYSNCPGPRPIPMIRPHRSVHEDLPPQAYQDRFHEANVRFKPYPTAKERPLQTPHSRYDYIHNYPNTFQPHPSYPPHKYELQKTIPTHPYSVYPPVPLKYLERRLPVQAMDKYPRSPNQQVNYNQPFYNQNMPSTYGTLPGNCLQNRGYAPDPSSKNMMQNRLYLDNNNSRKYYTTSENMFINDINRPPTIKTDLMYSTYPPINIHSLPPHHLYRKESSMKGYEHAVHYRNMEYSSNISLLGRLPLQFSPQTMSISPSDSNTSNDATQILGNSQDDCGYASQSSTASIRSIESGVNRILNDVYRRHDMTLPHMNKSGQKMDNSISSKDKKDLNVRQFLQMWNEGDDDGSDNNKETVKHRDPNNSLGCYESGNNQEQLYVLDLVNVPKEDLGKYDHIQKISKLPENIKGYNSIELLNQYEKLVESPGLNHFSLTLPPSKQKDSHIPIRHSYPRHGMEVSSANPRPLSPLDVEAKISQSVIHKEVGCNFEIRPCSPQMLNVELATTVHNVLGERIIEKVVNPVKTNSPVCQRIEETNNISSSKNSLKVSSCKMVSNQYPTHLNDNLKTNYCLQDLESNSGMCLASLPRLDNDIEFNFPEINQQFINDNKITSVQDLPILDTENGGITDINKNKIHSHLFTTENNNSGSDSDKDTSKLSKYRKQKKYVTPNDSDDTLNMSLHRTDSVIIKNPDNTKGHEEYIDNIPLDNNNTTNIENIVNPLHIAAETDRTINYSDKTNSRTTHHNYKSCHSDTAIDFSLNKCDDAQSNSVNNLRNLNHILKNNIEIDKEVDHNSTDKLCSKELPEQREEIASTDNLSILQVKSPILENITSSNVLDNNIVLQSIDENNEVPPTHETVITQSKSKEIVSDISFINISSLKQEIVSHNNLPLLNHDSKNISTNVTESIKALSTTENQPIDYCLAEHPESIIAPISEFTSNLEVEHLQDIDLDKNDPSFQKEENNTLIQGSETGSVPLTTNTDRKNDNIDDVAFQKSVGENIQTVLFESIGNEDKSDKMLKDVNKISNPEKLYDQDRNVIDNYGSFAKKCSHENQSRKEVTNVTSNVDCIKLPINSDILSISINDLNSTNIPCTAMDVFKQKYSLTNAETNNNILSDIKNESKISRPLRNGNSSIEFKKSDTNSCQVKYFTLNKELFSSRIQNLLIYNEGFCTSVINYGVKNKKELGDFFYVDIHCLQPENDNLTASFQLDFAENNIVPDFENNTNSNVMSRKNEKNENIFISNKSTEVVEYGPTISGSKHYDFASNNTAIELDQVQQSEIKINNGQDDIHTESIVVENYDSDSLLEVADQDRNDIILNKTNIDITDKINNYIEEKNVLPLLRNQFPNKRSRTLKRSLSESAVIEYSAAAVEMKGIYNNNFKNSRKRVKIADSEILVESRVLSENFTSFIQNNRRNSVSTIYNDENVSFCIFIDDDCVLTEDDASCQKICYTEIPGECLTAVCAEEDALNSEISENVSSEGTAEICNEVEAIDSELTTDIYYEDNVLIRGKEDNISTELNSENIPCEEVKQSPCENDLILLNMDDTTIEETWVEDVACMETVFNDDIAEDIIISAPSSPKDSESSEDEGGNTNFVYNINENEHTNKVKHIYGEQMCGDDAELVEKLYRTPQMNVNKTLIDRESQISQEYNRYYDNESLEKILSESNNIDTQSLVENDLNSDKSLVLRTNVINDDVHGNKENLQDLSKQEREREIYSNVDLPDLTQTKLFEERKLKGNDDCPIYSCESSCDNFGSFKKDEKLQYAISSSPEVSSTTSEEKAPAILLKIRSYKGSKISEVNEMSAGFNRTHSQRPLITKAAQKYIPPMKESIHDLKVKIRLPKQSLYKLQQLKKSKEKPKINTSCNKHYIKTLPQENLRKSKPKPKFEDVLMSIDKIQLKKHQTKNKKSKQPVPKVIIKKNENGAHYASTQTKETFNPDLTGRKWQPWVFLEKNIFVDKMALKQKFKAIYSHRKKTFVLAENFRKYKSISNAKFVISHPKPNDNNISTGNLKYTFRLKHS